MVMVNVSINEIIIVYAEVIEIIQVRVKWKSWILVCINYGKHSECTFIVCVFIWHAWDLTQWLDVNF